MCALKLEEEDSEVAVEEAVEQRASFAHLRVKGCQWIRRLIARDHVERRAWTHRPARFERAGMALDAHARRQRKREAHHFKSEALPDEAMPIRGKLFVHGFLDRLCLHVRVQTC